MWKTWDGPTKRKMKNSKTLENVDLFEFLG